MSNNAYTVLVTGTNRGIGLEFVKQYAADGWKVIACSREPDASPELRALAQSYDIETIALDVGDFEQIDKVANQLQGRAIDVLINNAGIYPESSLGDLDYEAWAEAFKINCMAPLKMAEAFSDHVASSHLQKIATLSSKMGSLDDNTSGGSYIYRTSKAAVNMAMKSLAIDLKPLGISVVTLHPGWVQTDMGGANALINTQTSVTGLRQVIERLSVHNSGKFIAYDGKEIAW
ncbi:MAG TPA: SDR family oxidoreductase [Methylotenera sp.]|nr:SDR family oxidoreductase [Methylotenera sp.]